MPPKRSATADALRVGVLLALGGMDFGYVRSQSAGAHAGPHLLLNFPIDSLHPVAARRRPTTWASERWAVGSGAAMRRVGMDTYAYGHYERRLVSDEASMEAAIRDAKEWG